VIEKRAHQLSRSLTLGELASKTRATLQGDPALEINGVGTIARASKGQITFLASPKYAHYLATTQASAVVLSPHEASQATLPAIVSADPKLTFAQIAHILYPFEKLQAGLHPTAIIGEGCEIHPNAYIGPYCVLGDRLKIGPNVILQSGCHIGNDCEIAEGTLFFPNVTVYHGCKIGRDCTLHSGVVIGSDGFGFAKNQSGWLKVPQVGGVKVGDRVEIGANTTIDRGAIEDTEIGNDVILDNLIQIAHNVKIGDGTAIAASVSIAGSATIGKHCQIGGASCIVGHLSITDHVNLVGSSNVGQSITQPGTYASGLTVNDIRVWKRNLVRFHQLDDMAKRLIEVEKKLKAQEEA
jgi:UDP-3-O-[3-hydroxymyristoyl] glucosamine N-acyltransferase